VLLQCLPVFPEPSYPSNAILYTSLESFGILPLRLWLPFQSYSTYNCVCFARWFIYIVCLYNRQRVVWIREFTKYNVSTDVLRNLRQNWRKARHELWPGNSSTAMGDAYVRWATSSKGRLIYVKNFFRLLSQIHRIRSVIYYQWNMRWNTNLEKIERLKSLGHAYTNRLKNSFIFESAIYSIANNNNFNTNF
jgi:hypothetical protein